MGVMLTALATTGLAGGALASTSQAQGYSSYLEVGSQGSGVSAVQAKLGTAVDGVFGPQTRAAVVAFQSRNGLTADGIVGPITGSALGLWSSGSATSGSTTTSGSTSTTGSSTYSGSTTYTHSTTYSSTTSSAPSSTLQRIARCESGGNPAAVDPSGTYRGKYQFDRRTWASVGGTGDPAAAPVAVQDAMAAKLLARSGTSPWPACGR
jgi:Transglycosylase-like domain/Putative peptidoglycan binding domain